MDERCGGLVRRLQFDVLADVVHDDLLVVSLLLLQMAHLLNVLLLLQESELVTHAVYNRTFRLERVTSLLKIVTSA